ncbi:MAG TPA: DNA polymerase, partial [Methanolinea sp.]|nr:DNA polymerase [Methanolinea sp.]
EEDGVWKEKKDQFIQFLKQEPGRYETWPATKAGPARDKDTLDKYTYIPEIAALRDVRSQLDNLKWFRDEAWHELSEHVDTSENRLRAWLNPYGTQTARNAPPARVFLPAMSAWLRVIVSPGEGEVFEGSDWSSQEFAIAAVLSGDTNMMEAYKSGDPYVYFAKVAGAIPQEAVNKWVKTPALAPEGEREKYAEFASTRDLFKATVLGLQYGMGAASLAVKLTIDTGRKITESDAKKLISLHKRAFPRLWKWQDTIEHLYDREALVLNGGWALLQDNPSALSVRNFPVQGTGSMMMHEALYLAQKRGIRMSFPLHDALYMIRGVQDTDAIKELEECMDEATNTILGDSIQIRHESVTVEPGKPWIEKKWAKKYEKYGRYLQNDLTPITE